MWQFLVKEAKRALTSDLVTALWGALTQRCELICTRNRNMQVHRCFIHYSPKLEITQVSCSELRCKQTLVLPASGAAPAIKSQELLTYATACMDLGHYACFKKKKKKKLISKAFTQYGSIYLTFSKWQNCRDKEQIRSYQDPLRLEGQAHLGGVAQGGPWW